jgi:hypothetical protein
MTALRSLLILALVAGAPAVFAQELREAPGAELRWLDKLTGASADVELVRGQSAQWGRLTIRLDACRYPADNPGAEAFAHVTILDSNATDPVFTGWMIATSPALSALDHPRYDVWVLRCLQR